jgi:hypothetical protein
MTQQQRDPNAVSNDTEARSHGLRVEQHMETQGLQRHRVEPHKGHGTPTHACRTPLAKGPNRHRLERHGGVTSQCRCSKPLDDDGRRTRRESSPDIRGWGAMTKKGRKRGGGANHNDAGSLAMRESARGCGRVGTNTKTERFSFSRHHMYLVTNPRRGSLLGQKKY